MTGPGMKRLIVGGALIALAGCTGSSSSNTSDPALVPPAEALATLENGPNPSADEITSWKARLGLLQTYCEGTERFISDTIVTAHNVVHDNGGPDFTYTQVAVGITHAASASGGATGQNCDKLAQDWVTLALSIAR